MPGLFPAAESSDQDQRNQSATQQGPCGRLRHNCGLRPDHEQGTVGVRKHPWALDRDKRINGRNLRDFQSCFRQLESRLGRGTSDNSIPVSGMSSLASTGISKVSSAGSNSETGTWGVAETLLPQRVRTISSPSVMMLSPSGIVTFFDVQKTWSFIR